jgi:hypothetical protein
MARDHAYPPDLARFVEANWPPATPLRVTCPILEQALSAAFQASLTSEEGRPTRFRLLLTPADALPASGSPNEGVLRLQFERSRPLGAGELRRLSPAAPFETSLIGAAVEQGELRIWGIAHSGPAWLAPTWGGRSVVPNWTYDPIIHVTAPGKIAIRSAGKLIGAIERGVVVDATLDAFESDWLKAMFAREREEVRAKHDLLQAKVASPTSVEPSLVGRIGQHMVKRAVQLIRGAGHGGMILVVGGDAETLQNLHGLRLKYRIGQDEPARRYRTLLFQILEAVSAATSKASVGWSDFELDPNPDLEKLEQAVFEWSRVMANLAAIDGAVVMDKRFGLLGFGAEVSAGLNLPPKVHRALDNEGVDRIPDDIENVGTRHRAAYRFVQEYADGLAIVVSQDGGVRFVANRDAEVVFWDQSVSP